MPTTLDNISLLCLMLDNFCTEHTLSPASADDMLMEEGLTDYQKTWLATYVDMWVIEETSYE